MPQAPPPKDPPDESKEALPTFLLQELAPAKAAKLAAQICGGNKKHLYELALTLDPKSQRN